jgi:hypothetical protein
VGLFNRQSKDERFWRWFQSNSARLLDFEADRDVRTDLELCIRGLTETNHEVLVGAAFILLDNALGEFDVATQVGAIEWLCLPDDPVGNGLLPLSDLPQVVNARQN